jgi:hypothetical protein
VIFALPVQTEEVRSRMRNSTLAALALMITVVGIAGCGPKVLPPPPAPPPMDPEIERKKEAARFQERIVMDEVHRTHPVLSAAIKGDLEELRQELAKAPKRINEVRRDMRLGPPLREACKRRWEAGITELMNRGAKCLGDPQCEACARAHAARMGVSPAGSGTGTTGMGVPGAGTTGTGSSGGYRLSPPGYPVPRMPPPGGPPFGTMP